MIEKPKSTTMASALLNRSFSKTYPYAIDAEGVYVTLETGQKILDGCCGAAVSCLGYKHPSIMKAMLEQLQGLVWIHTSFYTHDSQEELAKFLVQRSQGVFSRAAFYSSGSEAVETALKVARQYFVCNGEPERCLFLSRADSYHGNTLGALSAGYNRPRREAFAEICSPAFHHIDRCFYNKDALPGESEDEYLDRLLASYEAKFHKLGPSKVAAVLLEPVGGATLGSVPPASNYLLRVRELCDKYGALLIYDEVMCGMGRIGTYHAWESFGGQQAAPDIQAIGKGLAAGYQPLSAVLLKQRVYNSLSNDKGHLFANGHTYQGHALACGTALAVQRTIFEDDLLSNVNRQGKRLLSKLKEELDGSLIEDFRGCGLFLTVEFRTTEHPMAARIRDLCFERGLAVYLISGGLDAIMFAPAFLISDSETDEIVRIFVECVQEIASL